MRSRFVALTLIWGASFLFIKVGVSALAPMQVAFGRLACGAAVLLLFCAARREPLPRGRVIWAHLAIAAALANSLPFTLFPIAEEHVSTSLASIGNATVPLFTLLFAMLFLPDERPTARRTVGLAVGFGGVVIVLGVWRGLTLGPDLAGMLLILVAAASYGASGVYMRRFLSHTPFTSLQLSAGMILAGTIELGVLLPFATHAPAHLPLEVAGAVLALGAFGTGIAYVLSYGLIRRAGATVASMVTYFIPVVSIAIGVIGLGEHLAWNAPVGAVVIVAGAVISRMTPPSPQIKPMIQSWVTTSSSSVPPQAASKR